MTLSIDVHYSLMNLYNLIMDTASKNMMAPAIITHQKTILYTELLRESSLMATQLQEKGIQAGDVVGLIWSREPSFIEMVLAIWQCGAAFCPLSTEWPEKRIQEIITSHPFALIVTEKAFPHFPDRSIPTTGLTITQQDLAYVIFTTGSTGKQKGVMMNHPNVLNTLSWSEKYLALSPQSKSLCVSSLAFDLSIFDIFGLLLSGGSVYLATQKEILDPRALATIIQKERISLWNSTPFVLKLFLDENKSERFESVEQVLLSGDWIPLPLINQMRVAFPCAKITSLGGATETGIWGNYFPVNHIDPSWKSIPYGRPIPHMDYFIKTKPKPISITCSQESSISEDAASPLDIGMTLTQPAKTSFPTSTLDKSYFEQETWPNGCQMEIWSYLAEPIASSNTSDIESVSMKSNIV